MKAYLLATGTVFGLITLVHIWRMTEERNLTREPWFILITAVSAVLSVWAFRLARRKAA